MFKHENRYAIVRRQLGQTNNLPAERKQKLVGMLQKVKANLRELWGENFEFGASRVVGHGNLHPENILITPEGKAMFTNCERVSLTGPLRDLAQLTAWFDLHNAEVAVLAKSTFKHIDIDRREDTVGYHPSEMNDLIAEVMQRAFIEAVSAYLSAVSSEHDEAIQNAWNRLNASAVRAKLIKDGTYI